jgi:hypothetical protein
VSWSNVRDKLNIGLFDAAHLLAPWCSRRPPWWRASPAVTATRAFCVGAPWNSIGDPDLEGLE